MSSSKLDEYVQHMKMKRIAHEEAEVVFRRLMDEELGPMTKHIVREEMKKARRAPSDAQNHTGATRDG
jgi:hypothetical protein